MTPDQDFRIELKNHGSRQIEIKSHFPLGSGKSKKYALDIWFFVPSTLGMNQRDYGIERFFADLKSLTRFSASHVPLSSIIDPDCDLSPLVRIRREFEHTTMPGHVRSNTILYELRSLASIYSSESINTEAMLSTAVADGKLKLIKDRIKSSLKDIRTFLEQWQKLYHLFLTPNLPGNLKEAYGWADESIAITTEKFLYNLHENIGGDEEAESLLKKIRGMNLNLGEHRDTMGHKMLDRDSSPREIEERIYRESILKKWTQSVLYLTHQESSTQNNMNQILSGVAAAVAMTFAVITTIMAERYFPGRSLPWALALIAAYIFKDRIKETLRTILIHTIPSFVSDQRIRLTDQISKQVIGKVDSRIRFRKAGAAPAHIAAEAYRDDIPFRHVLPEDDLIHLRRGFTIRPGILRQHHSRLENLTDIVRLNLQSILQNMDDPGKDVPVFIDGKPSALHGHRTYPINLVLCLSGRKSHQNHQFRCRLILDRKGIRRIETENDIPSVAIRSM